MKYASPPGVFDIVPTAEKEPWRESHIWSHVERIIREVASAFGYREIRTPIFEKTELFVRGVGESSDIVSKEMYSFKDKGDRSLTLRPESTAPVLRSFIENHMDQEGITQKLFYICPQFRYERKQAGRYRQHHQFGAEAIGVASVEQDVEMIDMLFTLYGRLGLKDLKVQINSLGDEESRVTYRKALKEYLEPHLKNLSEDSQNRFQKNPLRILDSKDPGDQAIVKEAPTLLNFLSKAAHLEFAKAQKLLEALHIPYEVNAKLVRGLDYYNHLVFEVQSHVLGSQNSIGGGGRYDGLLKELEGPALPACGFGSGIERIIQTMIAQEVPLPEKYHPTLFLIALGDQAREYGFKLTHSLRQQDISVHMDFTDKKLGKVMQAADSMKASFVVVLGDKEIETGKIDLKDMSTGSSASVSLQNLPQILEWEQKRMALTDVWDEMAAPFSEEIADYFMKKMNDSIDRTAAATRKIAEKLKEMSSYLEDEET